MHYSSNLAHMEGIKEAAELFAVPKHLVRTLALEGKVKAVRVSDNPNAKILVNIQSLNEYFSNSFIHTTEETTIGIKPIQIKL